MAESERPRPSVCVGADPETKGRERCGVVEPPEKQCPPSSPQYEGGGRGKKVLYVGGGTPLRDEDNLDTPRTPRPP